uniref:Uncharacterized protein n=2 Tax=Rhodosorus marinus TaxID=101924 RepID=A0A7S2ZL10_9RHOD|mmetsp:Transcript_23365/g.92903  ORF Transcript_23365/g.92903 Transcript_23365/m.92903 type:complete len:413 (+) Transcript_23365:202-1440(+)|eukprot:CAMPEP_0113968444 /NCGR_PEP_ID=MMETSP0011_2-20120614/9540_1 /TAXON_ID=101924 /ORGANISM="Rhodosorus marinus" /LENGTH=412 /DNA_ID=CAMNT_0000981541 /DNA_START=36 /DNA_END=1274 /DNA_ORIENTATION=+ /assembly_acc=CAM_ASM_000156
MSAIGVFLPEDNDLREASSNDSGLWQSLSAMQNCTEVASADAHTAFVDSFLIFRRRPWQRMLMEEADDAQVLKLLDTAVYKYLEKRAEYGKLEAVTLLDAASLYLTASSDLLKLAIEKDKLVKESITAALQQLFIALRDIASGHADFNPDQCVLFVVDGLDMVRWVSQVVNPIEAIGDSAVEALQTLSEYYEVLVPQIVSQAIGTMSRNALSKIAQICRLSIVAIAEEIVHHCNEDERIDILGIFSGSKFGPLLKNRVGPDLITSKLSATHIQIGKSANREPEDERVPKEWYVGRVVDDQGYLYDDDVDDDEEDYDQLQDIDAAADENGAFGSETNASVSAPSSGSSSKARGGASSSRGRGRQPAGSSGSSSAKNTAVNSQRARASKEKKKSSVANHSRKDRALKKAGRGFA